MQHRYVSESGEPRSTFLRIVDLVDGTAERIEEAIRTYMTDKQLTFSRLMEFGSDGASVMTGKRAGLGTRLHQSNPYLIAIHCVAHRLALACSQAGEKVPYVQESTDYSLLVFPGQCCKNSWLENDSRVA